MSCSTMIYDCGVRVAGVPELVGDAAKKIKRFSPVKLKKYPVSVFERMYGPRNVPEATDKDNINRGKLHAPLKVVTSGSGRRWTEDRVKRTNSLWDCTNNENNSSNSLDWFTPPEMTVTQSRQTLTQVHSSTEFIGNSNLKGCCFEIDGDLRLELVQLQPYMITEMDDGGHGRSTTNVPRGVSRTSKSEPSFTLTGSRTSICNESRMGRTNVEAVLCEMDEYEERSTIQNRALDRDRTKITHSYWSNSPARKPYYTQNSDVCLKQLDSSVDETGYDAAQEYTPARRVSRLLSSARRGSLTTNGDDALTLDLRSIDDSTVDYNMAVWREMVTTDDDFMELLLEYISTPRSEYPCRPKCVPILWECLDNDLSKSETSDARMVKNQAQFGEYNVFERLYSQRKRFTGDRERKIALSWEASLRRY